MKITIRNDRDFEDNLVHQLITERLNKNSLIVDIGCELPLYLVSVRKL